MSVVIRVSAEVYAALQGLAEPLRDTPGDVIRALLMDRGLLPGARTYEQMRDAALAQRAKAINEDAPIGTFDITRHEACLLRMQPLDNIYLSSYGPDFAPKEICGIPLRVTR